MKKALSGLVATIAIVFSANAQPYANSVGVTFGPDWSGPYHYIGVQWNHFFTEHSNLDVRAMYQLKFGPLVEGLYEWDLPFGDSGFRFYGGPGVHAGIVTNYNGMGDSSAGFGFTAAAGFEYAFANIPIALSADWRPYVTWEPKLGNRARFGYSGVDFGLKFCF